MKRKATSARRCGHSHGAILRMALVLALMTGACSRTPALRTSPPPTTSASFGHGTAAPPATVPVTFVTDGDTIHVRYLGQDEKVRLIGVNTPEVDWYGGHGDCFGSEAGLYTRHRLDDRTVRLTFDARLRDPFGRLLAYVYFGDELFNLTLVEQGYAVNDPVPPDTGKEDLFAAAQRTARAGGRGLWAACPDAGY